MEITLKKALFLLDAEQFPEIHSYLDACNTDAVTDTPYEIAITILELDMPKTLPGFMIDFVTGLLELEISDDNADAMNDLGAQYYDGSRGFEQSFEKAVYYYKMAAEHGNRQAQENLGYCYYYGRDGEPDYEKAFHYFALGAFDGHLVSLYKIGDMYFNGLYVPENPTEAFHIYMHCIDTMTEEAAGRVAGPVYLRLGKMFLEGNGTEQNLRKAMISFQKAELFLTDMVMNGDVMYKKSLKEAVEGQKEVRKLIEFPEAEWKFD